MGWIRDIQEIGDEMIRFGGWVYRLAIVTALVIGAIAIFILLITFNIL